MNRVHSTQKTQDDETFKKNNNSDTRCRESLGDICEMGRERKREKELAIKIGRKPFMKYKNRLE